MEGNSLPIHQSPLQRNLYRIRNQWSWLAVLVGLNLIAIMVLLTWKPLLSLSYQQRAGKLLGEVLLIGDNDYGGFACLRPFIIDLEQRAKLQRAVEYLAKAQTLIPRESHTYYQIGRTACLLGDYERAIAAFQTFSELRPQNPAGFLEMGFALVQACPPNGKCANGLNPYDAWRKAGVRAEDFLAMAEKARAKGDYANALLWYQTAQRMGMELRSTIGYMKFLMFKKAEKKDEASLALESAVEMDHGWLDGKMRLDALSAYARNLFDKKQWKKAEKYFRIILQSNTSGTMAPAALSETYRLLGLAINGQGRLGEALPYLRQAAETYGGNLWAHIHYGKFLYWYDPNNIVETRDQFNQAISLTKDAAIYHNLMQFWTQVDRLDQVEYLCQQARNNGIDLTLLEECH